MDLTQYLILNVDDNDGARYAKTRMLQVAGFTVIEAANGTAALAMVREHLPALVLLDVKLPDINGLEVCRRIKADPASAMVLVLQTSAALTGSADKIRGLEGGADNYLAAPIDASELVANVNALLRLRRTQAELRESEERFRQMAENINDVFWIFSLAECALLYVSPAYESMWSCPSEQLHADPHCWLRTVHPDDQQRARTSFLQLFKDQRYDEEYRLMRPDGSVRWVRDRAFPVKNAMDVVYRMVRITSDITTAKIAEQALQFADTQKDAFLATLAHELRSPLGPIRNSIELMRQVEPTNDERQILARDVIARQVDYLARLVDDLMDIARISKGKISLRKTSVEVTTFVRAAVETSLPFINLRGHRLHVDFPDAPIWVAGDVVRLTQAVSNLLNNAAKYTPLNGEILLMVRRIGADTVRITVKDNGIGIAAADVATVFDLFSQGDTVPDRAQDGLGIGLSLVKQLVELHDGRIWVDSPGSGRGSSFEIELPVTAADELTRAGDTSWTLQESQSVSARSVLVVDDNPDTANVTAMLIAASGHATHTANNAASAIDAAREHTPDVILLDIGLPGMDGYEVARILRAQPTLAKTRLIAITGYGTERDRQKAREAGFDHHLVKPADLRQLLALIELSDAAPALRQS